MKIKSLLFVTLMALLPSFSQAEEILYGTWTGFPASHNVIYRIDPTNGVVSNIVTLTLSDGAPVHGVIGLAARPGDGVLFTLVRRQQFNEQFTNILATVDPNTGICTEIGPVGDVEQPFSLAFRSNSILYGGTGFIGGHFASLLQINQSTGVGTFLFALTDGSNNDGQIIAWHPNGTLYDAYSGNDTHPSFFNAVNVDQQTYVNLGTFPNTGGPTAMSYSSATNQLFLTDLEHQGFGVGQANLYTVNIQTGARTLVGDLYPQLPPSAFPSAVGLAFVIPITISGTVFYCANSPLPVPNATVILTGTTSDSKVTDANGFYQFTNIVTGGSYTVTATKTPRLPGSNGINTIDVLAVQRHILGFPLTGCHLAAADVDNSGTVSTADIIAIQRFYASVPGTANVGKYKFTPASRTYSGITASQVNQNYDALIYGDVIAPFVEPTQ